MSYDATFESVDIPAEILAMRDERLRQRRGNRIDDVEFTFTKGRWGHLGEATLVNRVKVFSISFFPLGDTILSLDTCLGGFFTLATCFMARKILLIRQC